MDRLLGSIIDDETLYRIIEAIIAIVIMVASYFGIQIALALKFVKKEGKNKNELIAQASSYRSTIFILIGGISMLVHEFLEGLEKDAADFTTYEMLELIALLGLVLFLYEWHKTLKKMKNKNIDPFLSRPP
ncbi:Uncharacterised protein [uncultured archaeon]|nr:Uncharacterised protein [uncultured archaeon]